MPAFRGKMLGNQKTRVGGRVGPFLPYPCVAYIRQNRGLGGTRFGIRLDLARD